MNQDMQDRLVRWEQEVRSVNKQITAAEVEYKKASDERTERKQQLEELRATLRRLCDRGPYEDEGTPSLLDGLDEVDAEDSIRSIKLPGRIYGILETAGIRTVERLEAIIEGFDEEYDSIDDVPGIDVDAKNRIVSEFQDTQEGAEPISVPYSSPVSQPEASEPPASGGDTEIVLNVDIPDSELKKGMTARATLMPTGQAVIELPEGEEIALEVGEFSLSAVAAV